MTSDDRLRNLIAHRPELIEDLRLAVSLDRAVLCLDCESIYAADVPLRCPVCGSETAWMLERLLDHVPPPGRQVSRAASGAPGQAPPDGRRTRRRRDDRPHQQPPEPRKEEEMTRRVVSFEKTVHKTCEWLDELGAELGWDDRQQAYVALRAVLHALRDRLPVNEAADLAAQLPMLVRGFYFEGWRPAGTPVPLRHREEFLAPLVAAIEWRTATPPEAIARAVFRLLRRHLTYGELEDVLQVLPHEIRELAEPAVQVG